jgi:type IV pilus assembly protein PilE
VTFSAAALRRRAARATKLADRRPPLEVRGASSYHPITLQGELAMNQARGFTLIEVMIVVAIIGILAAVAYPSYNAYIDRGKAADAVAALSDQRVRMEQYFQDNRNYGATNCRDGGGTPQTWPVQSGKKYFNVTCALTNSGAGFTLTASSASGPQFTYTVNETNTRATTYFGGAAATCTNGWQTKKGESSC